MVQPKQSSHFEFYEDGSGTVVTPLRESALYLEDRLGLKVVQFYSDYACAMIIFYFKH